MNCGPLTFQCACLACVCRSIASASRLLSRSLTWLRTFSGRSFMVSRGTGDMVVAPGIEGLRAKLLDESAVLELGVRAPHLVLRVRDDGAVPRPPARDRL